ncbi:MAG TPA: c-type cytochrome biogenesis protein CcmI [Usitatibacter sp.]|jgi:cytochrome c-type biogenesis protein CcmH|nr:c-type cytochrome biogenesis protein CcmI [Usitatibacter sp.]
MVVFWLLAVLMTAVALGFVLVPLLRTRPATGPSSVEANLDVLRSQRREIEADVANGTLPAEARDEALAELVRRADGDLVPVPPPAATPGKPWITAAVVAIALPLLAFGLYLARGTPAAADPRVAANGAMDPQQIVAMVEKLAQKVHERPDDVQGWALLARSMATLGRFREAADAYEHLSRLAPGDPSVLADYADSLAMAQGQKLSGKPYELAQQALALDPTHPKALALAASAAMEANDFATALGYWKSLEAQLPPDSEDMTQVRAIMADIEAKAHAPGQPVVRAAVASQARAPSGAASGAVKSVTGSVVASPQLASRIRAGDTLFIYARAENGPRMPLAIIRGTAAQLPMKFALDDSQSMSPSMKLSTADAVRIEARVSRSGNAMPQAGDIIGTSPVVKPGTRDVNIVLDKVVP